MKGGQAAAAAAAADACSCFWCECTHAAKHLRNQGDSKLEGDSKMNEWRRMHRQGRWKRSGNCKVTIGSIVNTAQDMNERGNKQKHLPHSVDKAHVAPANR
jgi:hypothetical protein